MLQRGNPQGRTAEPTYAHFIFWTIRVLLLKPLHNGSGRKSNLYNSILNTYKIATVSQQANFVVASGAAMNIFWDCLSMSILLAIIISPMENPF